MAAVTARTPGNGTGTLTYTLTSDTFDVEAVYVAIDATGAGGDVTAELTIADQSGAVIARKVQTQTVAAGGTGSATWGLRLDDDGGAGISEITSTDASVTVTNPFGPVTDLSVSGGGGYTPPKTMEHLRATNVALPDNATTQCSWSKIFGTSLFSLTDPLNPTVVTSGIYALNSAWISTGTMTDDSTLEGRLQVTTTGQTPNLVSAHYTGLTSGIAQTAITIVFFFDSGATFQGFWHTVGVGATPSVGVDLWVSRIT